jgi:hypothetical protein
VSKSISTKISTYNIKRKLTMITNTMQGIIFDKRSHGNPTTRKHLINDD